MPSINERESRSNLFESQGEAFTFLVAGSMFSMMFPILLLLSLVVGPNVREGLVWLVGVVAVLAAFGVKYLPYKTDDNASLRRLYLDA